MKMSMCVLCRNVALLYDPSGAGQRTRRIYT